MICILSGIARAYRAPVSPKKPRKKKKKKVFVLSILDFDSIFPVYTLLSFGVPQRGRRRGIYYPDPFDLSTCAVTRFKNNRIFIFSILEEKKLIIGQHRAQSKRKRSRPLICTVSPLRLSSISEWNVPRERDGCGACFITSWA